MLSRVHVRNGVHFTALMRDDFERPHHASAIGGDVPDCIARLVK